MNARAQFLTATLLTGLIVGACPAAWSQESLADADPPQDPSTGTFWLDDLDEAHRRATSERKPVLVCVAAGYCAWCRKLEETFQEPAVQEELAGWTPVRIDGEKSPQVAARLGVEAFPALRVLSPGGRLVASREGYLAADELIEWLEESRRKAQAVPDDVLFGASVPDAADVVRIVSVFTSREASLREAAVDRLLPHAAAAAEAVVESFEDGGLHARLTALEILTGWKAPIDGLDPWRPDTLTKSRLDALRRWSGETSGHPPASSPREPSVEELATVALEIDRMLRAREVEADVIRLRLGRLGDAALPQVVGRLDEAESDRDRGRLLALRYQLVAGDALDLAWPGGISRLAATDSQVRQKAAEELAERSDARDLPLLLALFADPDPMVREICLRGVQSVGGSGATPAIGGLLKDPDANVRAAVLNLLAENPQASMVSKVAEYLETETDPDLIVHAVRFLRAVQSSQGVEALTALLDHESWQVRAEAAEGLGQRIGADELPSKLRRDVQVALIDLLADDDAFVVSRAIGALGGVDMVAAVEPLIDAARSHPELAADVIQTLVSSDTTRSKALPRIREFGKHEDPLVRAAALPGLYSAGQGNDMDDLLLNGLSDQASVVRIAAARVVLQRCESERFSAVVDMQEGFDGSSFQIIESSGGFTVGSIREPVVSTSSTLDPFGGVEAVEVLEIENSAAGSLADLVADLVRGAGRAVSGDRQSDPPELAPVDPFELEPPVLPGPIREDTEEIEEIPEVQIELPEFEQRGAEPLEVEMPDVEDIDASRLEIIEMELDFTLPEIGEEAGGLVVPEPSDPSPHPWDDWLGEYLARERPESTTKLIAPLEKMLDADEVEERLAAASALLPLGKQEAALPVIVDALESADAGSFEAAAGALVWLAWPDRSELFSRLLGVAGEGQLGQIVEQMATIPDDRVAELLFEIAADPEFTILQAAALYQAFRSASLLSSGDDMPADDLEKVVGSVKTRAAEGSELQRLLALTLLTELSKSEAAAVAKQIVEDETAPANLRRDALQIALLVQRERAAIETAVTLLSRQDADLRQVALGYLVDGPTAISLLRETLYVEPAYEASQWGVMTNGPRIIPKPPRTLKAEDLRPLLDDTDAAVAAQVGYLLALLEDSSGLQKLLDYWRQQADEDPKLDQLVYRAVAALDAPSQSAVLETIYERLDSAGIHDFYWTIRAVTDPEVFLLRKRIRDEVGVDNLQ